MFQAIRRYCSILTLILMSVVCVSIVVDEYGDPQQLVKQTTATSGMEVIADDFDCDEDEEDGMVSVLFVEDHSTSLPAPVKKCKSQLKAGVPRLCCEARQGVTRPETTFLTALTMSF